MYLALIWIVIRKKSELDRERRKESERKSLNVMLHRFDSITEKYKYRKCELLLVTN